MKHFMLAAAFAAGAILAATSAFAATMQCAPQQQISTSYPSGSNYTADTAGIVQGVASVDVKDLAQSGCVTVGIGNGGLCGELLNVNMNVGGAGAVGDQPLNWFVPANQWYRVTKITARNASRSFSAGSAAGGVYTGLAKPANPVVAATQVFTGLTALTATANLDLTLVAGVGTLGEYVNKPLVFSLTTADGSAGTIDLFAYCDIGN